MKRDAQAGSAPIVANPLDLPYRVQTTWRGRAGTRFREAADPSVVKHQGRYLLFASMSGGFWYSSDLVTWEFCPTPELPIYDYAPDAAVVDDHLVVCASRRRGVCDFYRSVDPVAGDWEVLPGDRAFWDPALFQDDDGRLYLYEGCSAKAPIRGVELDRSTFRTMGAPVDLVRGNPTERGWEVPAEDWNPEALDRSLRLRLTAGTRPFIEGAWMTKHGGQYYLQYAAPGTEFNGYADGYLVGESPLGPFEYGANSPFSSKPGGFMTAAGHGSTFQDKHGNWWHAATMRISRHHPFERRIGIFPAGFDDDGVLFCNQEFADYPLVIPSGRADPWSLSGHFMVLSKGKAVAASSEAPGHRAPFAVSEDVREWWTAASAAEGEWLVVDLGEALTVAAIQVTTIDAAAVRTRPPAHAEKVMGGRRVIALGDVAVPFTLEVSGDGDTWRTVRDARAEGRPNEFVVLDEPDLLKFVRVTGGASPLGAPFSVAGLRVFGWGAGGPPAAVSPTARRVDARSAQVNWSACDGAHGYNVRYGIAPEKLYHCWQVDEPGLGLRSLTRGVDYWVAVDSFNENGVTQGAPTPILRR